MVLLLIAAGAIAANGDWRQRLAAAFGPGTGEAANVSIDAWIDPPAYTGEAPVYLSQSDTHRVTIPTGSTLNLRVHGASHAPYLSVDGARFEGGSGEYASNARITENTSVAVRAGGRTIGYWRLRVLPDEKPVIAFSSPPARTEHDALKLAFTAGDDYGVVAARAHIRPHGHYGKDLVVALPLDSASAKTVTQTSFRDLTAHPDLVTRGVDPHVADLELVGPVDLLGIAVARNPPERGANPRRELAQTKRLRYVVVGADLEADDGVDLAIARGDHDDRHPGTRADLTAHVDAGDLGEHHVEQDERGAGCIEALDRLRAVGRGHDEEALALERNRQRVAV